MPNVITSYVTWVNGNRKMRTGGAAVFSGPHVSSYGGIGSFSAHADLNTSLTDNTPVVFMFWSIQSGAILASRISLNNDITVDVGTDDVTLMAWYRRVGGGPVVGPPGILIDAFNVNVGDVLNDDFVNISPDNALYAQANNDGFVPTGSDETITAFPSVPAGAFQQWRVFTGSETPAGLNLPAQTGDTGVAIAFYKFTIQIPPVHQCVYSLSSTQASYSQAGGNGSFDVSADRSTCAWSATPSDSWITIVSGASGHGAGTVQFHVAPNTTPSTPRTGMIAVEDQVFTVWQDACYFKVPSNPYSLPPEGGSGSFAVTTSMKCHWQATSSNTWIHITSSSSGTGSGTVSFTVDENPRIERVPVGPPPKVFRYGMIRVADQTYTIKQQTRTEQIGPLGP